jgi:hypothetical protein
MILLVVAVDVEGLWRAGLVEAVDVEETGFVPRDSTRLSLLICRF